MLSRETYARRHAGVRALLAERGLDALIVYGLAPPLNANLEYVAGDCRTNGLALFPAAGDGVLWVQPKALVPFVSRTAVLEVRNGGVDYGDELIGELRARRVAPAPPERRESSAPATGPWAAARRPELPGR